MNKNLRRLLSLSVIAACAFAPAYAYDMKDEHKHNMQHAVPPGQYPGGDDSLDFFVGASYTYWVPYQTGMVIGQGRTGAAGNYGNFATPSVEGASGFKVMLGANTQHDAWNVQIEYTWFYRSPGFSANNLKNSVPYTATFNQTDVLYTELSSKFKNQFNRIDAMVDRSFYAGHYLAFRPWLGLLGAFDYQDLDYNAVASGAQQQARFHQDWWGIGPYAGAEATFYFTNEWGLFISSGASLLLSNHDVRMRLGNVEDGTLSPSVINTKDNFNGVEPMVEAKLGLRWDSNWTDWALRIDVAWEAQTYFNHNGFLPYYSPTGVQGDYSMQGLTVGVRVNF